MADIIILAHRGSNPYPDHSQDAYTWAVNWGADFIEPDLYLTKDGVLVASHDNHNYNNLTYAEAKAIEPALLTFGEVIELAKAMSVETGRDIGIIPETKSTDYATSEAVIQALIEHEFTDPERVIIQSFNNGNLKQLHDTIMPEYGVDIPLAFLGSGIANPEDIATYADIVAPSVNSFSDADVAAAHAAGLKVVTWTILGSKADIQKYVDMGVDAIFVDDTKLARTAAEEIAGVKVIYGTASSDSVAGTAGDDMIYSMQGDDTVRAGNGDDVIYGDGGNDLLFGGAGDDLLIGGAGNDFLSGGEGADLLSGGAGNDVIVATGDRIIFRSGDGIDLVSLDNMSTVSFGDVASTGVTVIRDGAYLIVRGGGDALVIRDEGDVSRLPGSITFADDVTLSGSDLAELATVGSDAEVAAALPGLEQVLDAGEAVPGNTAPEAVAGEASGSKDTPITGQLVATDADGDTSLTFALENGPSNGTVVVNPDGTYQYIPSAGFSGDDSFTFTVSDGEGALDTESVNLTIFAAPPLGTDLLVNGSFEDMTGLPEGIRDWGTFSDAGIIPGWQDKNGKRVELHKDTQNGVNAKDGTYYMDMDGAGANNHIVQIIAGVETGATYRLTFSIADADGTTNDDGVRVLWNGQVVYEGIPDNTWNTLSFDVVGGSGDNSNKLEFVGTAANLNWYGAALDEVSFVKVEEPNLVVNGGFEDLTGADNIANWGYRNTDPAGVIAGWVNTGDNRAEVHKDTVGGVSAKEGTYWFDMEGAPNNARLEQTVAGVVEGETYQLKFSIADTDTAQANDTINVYWGGELVYTGTPNATWQDITIDVMGGSGDGSNKLVFASTTPNPNGAGVALDDISLRKTENSPPPNTAPVATDDADLAAEHGVALTIVAATLLANDSDADADTLSILSVQDALGGTVVLDDDGNVVFTPSEGFAGEASFTYTVSDGQGGTATASVTVAVAAQPGGGEIVGTPGDDELLGTSGDDIILAGLGDDVVAAGAGDDVVEGGEGDDVLDGEDGNDVLKGGAGDDELSGGAGEDVLNGGEGDDVLDGGEGTDTADYSGDTAGVVVNLADGEAEGDEAGFDELSGIENVIGGSGDDELTGDDADNRLNGGLGNDVLHGGAGNDVLDGGDGNDELNGGEGDDILLAGLGNDVIDGGVGFDTLDLSSATGPVSVDFGAGRVSGTGIGTDSFVNIEKLLFGAGDDAVTGGNGDDAFDGGAGNDTLKGGAGDDELWGGEGDDLVDGGSGDDALQGGLGDDVVKAGSGDDVVDGGDGDDQIDGGSGDDILIGGLGNDIILGGSGDDRILGGAGDDILSGGSGHDAFVFASGFGHDTITDFKISGSSSDVLEFDTDIFADFALAMASAEQDGKNVVFIFDADNTITLEGVQLSSLAADDFRFV